jgi:hypothetical protein
VTARAAFGAAMTDATAALERADRDELIGVLDRLARATAALVDTLRADAPAQGHEWVQEPPGASDDSLGIDAVRSALRDRDAG